MNIICDINILKETVSNISLAVASKTTIISLEGILLEAKENSLTLTGYNLDIGIIKKIPIQIIEEGSIVLNARLFSDTIKKFSSGDITIKVDEKNVAIITIDNSEFTFNGIKAEDYPEIPTVEEGTKIKLSSKKLKNMISQTLFAISTSDQNPTYTGSCFEISEGFIKIISLDGYRMAFKKTKIEYQGEFSFIVPGNTLRDITKLIKDDDENLEEEKFVNININENHIFFKIEEYYVISRLLQGEFIKYQDVMNVEEKTKISVYTKDFIKSIEKASIIINDRLKSPIKCTIKDNSINVMCSTSLGKVIDSFPISILGEDIIIGFNNKYMTDALKATEEEEVSIIFANNDSPIKIVPLNGDDFVYIVLPVRLKYE